ncbi:MAG: EI24 domain-containing protein [Burkholderiales bacterium]|nr:MAG: EI24 domain-containing protein [Burkholderiales bacterium]
MSLLFDAFWRAVAYCLHPRVIAFSLLPLLLMVVLSFALGYFFWDAAVASVMEGLQSLALVQAFFGWLERIGMEGLRTVLAPLLVLMLATPLIVLGCLLLVAVFMTPAMVSLVGRRRFPGLEKKRGGSLMASILWSFGSTLLAVVVLVLSVPLWLIPPLVLILPPLIWGWLTYRVFAFDALAEHASADERQRILKEHRSTLLVMGILTGYLGAAPSLLWASGALFIALAPLLVPVAIWIYTLVFAFASLWFAHYGLAVLQKMRADRGIEVLDAVWREPAAGQSGTGAGAVPAEGTPRLPEPENKPSRDGHEPA